MTRAALSKESFKGIGLVLIIGLVAVVIEQFSRVAIMDTLLLAMLIGIILRSITKFNPTYLNSFSAARRLFIPIGVIFYGAVNLNFFKFATIDIENTFLIFIVFIVFLISTLVLSSKIGLSEKTGYLIAAGSAICGASAIAITSDAIEAEPDEVSTSVIAIFISAIIGLYVIFPLARSHIGISDMDYGILSGTTLQFTGFVKAVAGNLTKDAGEIALSIKAVRYVGLLFLIPLFGTFVKGKFYVPWYIWGFLGAGLLFTFAPFLSEVLGPAFKIVLNIVWSTAMAAIGLSADPRHLLSKNGIKALAVSTISFLIAAGVFLFGIRCM